MEITPQALEFLKMSQKLSGATLLITDNENTVIEIKPDETISYEKRKISEELKKLDGDRKKDRNEMIAIFENDNLYYSAQIVRRLYKAGESAGFIVYYSDYGDFFDSMETFIDTAKYFVEKMLNEM